MDPNDPKKFINEWLIGVANLHRAHFESAKSCERKNYIFGSLIVIISAVAGSAAFSSLQTSDQPAIKITVGGLGILAAVLASLQTFLHYSERAEKHKTAATRYGILRRELEQNLSSLITDGTLNADFLTSFRNRWDNLDLESPTVPDRIYKKASKATA